MRRLVFVLMVLLAVGVATSAQGATLSYAPGEVSMTVEPGQTGTVKVVVTPEGQSTGFFYIKMGAKVVGDIPRRWIAPRMYRVAGSDVSTRIVVRVPADAQDGTYTAHVRPTLLWNNEPVDVGEGVELTLTVAAEKPGCQEAPVLSDMKIGPEDLFAPNHKMVDVEVTGQLAMAENCELKRVWYVLEDEYGQYDATGDIQPDASGALAVKIPVKVERRGKDKDGRVYKIYVYAEDVDGRKSGEGFVVRVLHDRGNKGKK